MTVKDVLKATATFTRLDDVSEFLNDENHNGGNAAATAKKVNMLVSLCNLVVSELAATYIPMIYAETVSAVNGKIRFSDLYYNVTRMLSVKRGENQVDFEFTPEYAITGDGTFTVEYEYAPPEFGIDDEIKFSLNVSSVLLAYGLAAEYCVTEGRFEEAVLWRKRYGFGVEKLVAPKSATLKGRCWL